MIINGSSLFRVSKWGRLVGDNLGKMAKNCMKITKSEWGDPPPPQFPLHSGKPALIPRYSTDNHRLPSIHTKTNTKDLQ